MWDASPLAGFWKVSFFGMVYVIRFPPEGFDNRVMDSASVSEIKYSVHHTKSRRSLADCKSLLAKAGTVICSC